MVTTTFVSFGLLTGLVVVGGAAAAAAAAAAGGAAAGAEDQAGPRSSGLMTVAAPRKLSKNSKASNADAGLSEEDGGSLLRFMVFEKAVDVYRSTQPAPSSAKEEEAAARADTNESGHELLVSEVGYRKYACTGCVGFFLWVNGLTPDEQEYLCVVVVQHSPHLEEKYRENPLFLKEYFEELVQCSSTPLSCCQSEGVCLN